MHDFSVQLTRQAAADLGKLPKDIHRKVIQDISDLAADPFPEGQAKKKLKGFKFALYRLRSGNHCVLYRIDGKMVTIMRVIDRKDLDKIAKRLKLSPPGD